MPPRHPSIARALGVVRRTLNAAGAWRGADGVLHVMVACSGGPDSIALLGLLDLIARAESLSLRVGHVDHGLRAESAQEAAMVERLADRHRWPFRTDRLQLAAGPGLPARARDERRAALRRQAEQLQAPIIALGHTATDQAETMLLHLARGAGLDGLAGMPALDPWPDGAGAWWRPVLGLDRTQTRALASRLELPFVDDPTNVDDRHPRIAIRDHVLPVLRRLNPNADHALAATASRVREAADAIEAWVATEAGRRRSTDAEGHTTWTMQDIARLPRAVRLGIIRSICVGAGVPADALARDVVAQVDGALCESSAPHRWDLHGNRRLRYARGRVWVETGPGE